MAVLWQKSNGLRKDERGFTLPELMTAVGIYSGFAASQLTRSINPNTPQAR